MRLFALFVAMLLAACGTPPKLNYYTLDTSAPPAAGAGSSPSVFVGPVTVPDGVDRAEIVLGVAPNQVELEELHRWAEPLKNAIPRVLADTLARELGTQNVMTGRQSSTTAFDYRVAMDVRRFESSYGEGATIDALWVIRTAKGGEPRTGRSTVHEAAPSRDAQGIAAAHSRALEQLGREIAGAIRSLDRP
jgi:uncharacterized protein